eukprot:TRINITY_DN6251_c0_g1_i1.p2 TRINITY_DN6251_c0_g1~~TRINITY_DN6251_c0_g1_i1.p2  ORF type:complete len:197 (-),score=41.26 TRINITY_DN6251_c0_g1_i1:1457-2047(-)
MRSPILSVIVSLSSRSTVSLFQHVNLQDIHSSSPVLTEGIFRLSGEIMKINALKDKYNRGDYVDLEAEKADINAVCGLLKLWLRELPEPLLTFKNFEPVMQLEDLPEDEKLVKTTEMIEGLPLVNKVILSHILRLLKETSTHQDQNKMSCNNLAIVLSYSILRMEKSTPEMDLKFSQVNCPLGGDDCDLTAIRVES